MPFRHDYASLSFADFAAAFRFRRALLRRHHVLSATFLMMLRCCCCFFAATLFSPLMPPLMSIYDVTPITGRHAPSRRHADITAFTLMPDDVTVPRRVGRTHTAAATAAAAVYACSLMYAAITPNEWRATCQRHFEMLLPPWRCYAMPLIFAMLLFAITPLMINTVHAANAVVTAIITMRHSAAFR